jgi:hypothetical protein
MTTKERESERFDRWWTTQDWDGAYEDVAWDAWWEAVRDATDEEIIEVLLPDQEQKREIRELRAQVARLRAIVQDHSLSAQQIVQRLRTHFDRTKPRDIGQTDA